MPKDCLTEPPFNAVQIPAQQWSWQLKNDEKLQSGTPEKNCAGGKNFRKGHFFGRKDTLTNANFRVKKNFY